jgi:hypothetical protein
VGQGREERITLSMKRIAGIVIVIGLGIFALTACSKSGGTATTPQNDPDHVFDFTDTTFPVIEITTPTPDQVFKSGTAINITGKLSDNSLYQGTIKIRDDDKGYDVKEQLYEIHGLTSYNFNYSYTLSVANPTNFSIIITFEDHGFNKSSKSVKIKVNP